MCVSTTHRQCENVEPIEETATKLREYFEGKEFDLLLEHVGILEDKLMRTITDQEMSVRQIKNTSERISEETERVFEDAIHHLQFLKNQFLTNMSKCVKKSKESYEKNINSLLDGIHCAQFIAKKMGGSTGNKNAVALAVVYYSGKKCFDRLKKYDFQQLHTSIEENKPDILKEIMHLTSVSDVKFFEKTNSVNTDLKKKKQLCLITEISMEGKFIRDGTLLSFGEFIFSTRDTSRHSKSNDACFIYNKCGKLTGRLTRPFGIFEIENDTILACSDSKCLQFFEIKNRKFKKSLKLSKERYCIAYLLSCIYVANGDKIIKINKTGLQRATINTGPSVKHITSTSSKIIYSNRKSNEVVAMDAYGTTMWRYSSPGLLSPCGLSVDGEDNIYVAGKESDNIHMLTKDGQCVRVFEDITRPDFMKVVAINGQGTTVWRYSSPRLLSPCGLGVDGDDNIYVAGKESDNVHVLTRDGQFVHVFEDITRPDFMKVDKEMKLCFVGSMRKYVRVYEML